MKIFSLFFSVFTASALSAVSAHSAGARVRFFPKDLVFDEMGNAVNLIPQNSTT